MGRNFIAVNCLKGNCEKCNSLDCIHNCHSLGNYSLEKSLRYKERSAYANQI